MYPAPKEMAKGENTAKGETTREITKGNFWDVHEVTQKGKSELLLFWIGGLVT
jgi:hypothetical protein